MTAAIILDPNKLQPPRQLRPMVLSIHSGKDEAEKALRRMWGLPQYKEFRPLLDAIYNLRRALGRTNTPQLIREQIERLEPRLPLEIKEFSSRRRRTKHERKSELRAQDSQDAFVGKGIK